MRAIKVLALLLCCSFAWASGPRWITPRGPIVWYTTDLHYYTDQGPLSTTVDNPTAQALVAAAAAPWGNVVNSTLFLRRGGSLDEDVSAANVTVNASGPVFPTDAGPANYMDKPIAIVFDTDGALIDALLGQGASDPSLCLQNAVSEDVDLILAPNHIGHAVIILNGRCTGVREQQLQMQYQLMRAFGRVLGLGWSQTNDNVFTGTPAPNYQQALHWPIMHPIDIVCGPYTYQCLPYAFQLRPDDIGSVDLLYFHGNIATGDGRTFTYQNAADVDGHVSFPNGQGMQGVNMVVQGVSPATGFTEYWETSSSVTGFFFRADMGNTVTGWLAAPMGIPDAPWEGYYRFGWLPIPANEAYRHFKVTMQPLNPLYTGAYAVGPYQNNVVVPSGQLISQTAFGVGVGTIQENEITSTTAPSNCGTYQAGTEQAPSPVAVTGFWSGRLCGTIRADWSIFSVKAGHVFTVEATAIDEQQRPSAQKVVPVIGLWNASDKTAIPATMGTSLSPFNTISTGTTALSSTMPTARQMRLAISDIRSDVRPDFGFQARIIYADKVTPSQVAAIGGTISIAGIGFRPGAKVTIAGLDAAVQSVTSTSITAMAPPLISANGRQADLTILDPATGGIATIPGALIYAPSANILSVTSLPSSPTKVGSQSSAPFSIRLLTVDGKPVANAAINFTALGNAANLNPCGAPVCASLTDANGMASVSPTPITAGSITLQAATSTAATISVQMLAVAPARLLSAVRITQYVAALSAVSWAPAVMVTQDGSPVVGQPVLWSAQSGAPSFSISSTTTTLGIATSQATTEKLADGAQDALTACAWTNICTPVIAQAVGPSDWFLAITSGGNQVLKASATFAPLVIHVTDRSGHSVAGVVVQIYQTVMAWQPPCSVQGRCPTPPVYLAANTSGVSDEDGLLQVSPAVVTGMAADTHVVAAAGTNGYVATTLSKTP